MTGHHLERGHCTNCGLKLSGVWADYSLCALEKTMNGNDPESIVETGYDDIAHTYHEQRDKFKNNELLTEFSSLLPPHGNVLDVGCGAGVPVARFLVDAGFNVTGVDVSSSMLDLARDHVRQHFSRLGDQRCSGFVARAFDPEHPHQSCSRRSPNTPK